MALATFKFIFILLVHMNYTFFLVTSTLCYNFVVSYVHGTLFGAFISYYQESPDCPHTQTIKYWSEYETTSHPRYN